MREMWRDRRMEKGIAKQRLIKGPKWLLKGKSGHRAIWLSGLFQRKDKAHQFFGSMRQGNMVVLPLGPLFSEVSSKGRVPETDILGGVVKGVAKVPGAALLHVWVAVLELTGLVSRGRHPGIG